MSTDPRRKPLRAQGFDYSTHGAYYVTICVDRMERRFGRIIAGILEHNSAGTMIDLTWRGIPDRFPAVDLDVYVVMPNHLHGILIIDHDAGSTPPTLSRIIQAFKSETTVAYGRGVKAGWYPPYDRGLWQRGFHDRIIRNDRMLDRAREYIVGNPGKWAEDRYWVE